MTTDTPPADPTIEAWSDRLEEDLVEAGMETQQARAYRYAFELGLTRVISQTATRQELKDGLALSSQELKDGLADLRSQIREMATKQELKDGLADLRSQIREMATKQELRDNIADVRREISDLRDQLNARLDRMERRFLLWGGGVFGLLVALVVRAFS